MPSADTETWREPTRLEMLRRLVEKDWGREEGRSEDAVGAASPLVARVSDTWLAEHRAMTQPASV